MSRHRYVGPAEPHREMEVKDFRVACGEFIGVSDVEKDELPMPGFAVVPAGIPYADGMFAAQARGDSMDPKIADSAWPIFHPNVVGTRQDRIVLVEDRSKAGVDRYTLKKYRSRKTQFPDGTWAHDEILLFPLNPAHSPIRLDPNGNYDIRGWFVASISQIKRVEPPKYRYVAEE